MRFCALLAGRPRHFKSDTSVPASVPTLPANRRRVCSPLRRPRGRQAEGLEVHFFSSANRPSRVFRSASVQNTSLRNLSKF
jgi:hypothetical protein